MGNMDGRDIAHAGSHIWQNDTSRLRPCDGYYLRWSGGSLALYFGFPQDACHYYRVMLVRHSYGGLARQRVSAPQRPEKHG